MMISTPGDPARKTYSVHNFKKIMLFACSNCKTRFRISDERIKPEGSKFKCSKCLAILLVKNPTLTKKKEPGVSSSHGMKPGEDIEPSFNKTRLALKPREPDEEEQDTQNEETPPSPPPMRSYWAGNPPGHEEDTDSRPFLQRLPEVFIFPFKGTGKLLIIIGTVVFWILELIASFFIIVPIYGWILAIFVFLFIGGFLSSYMMKVITYSADGEKEPPDWPDVSAFLEDIVCPFFRVLWTILICFSPSLLYLVIFLRHITFIDPVLWLLFVCGLLYLPMSLIAVSMSGSILSAMNPAFIIPSILKVPLDYLVACVVLITIVGFRMAADKFLTFIPFIGSFIGGLLALYLLIVEARILGLIYYTNKERLNWFGEGE
jgi:predicted Zn finger-like uncharacterized protein